MICAVHDQALNLGSGARNRLSFHNDSIVSTLNRSSGLKKRAVCWKCEAAASPSCRKSELDNSSVKLKTGTVL